jgi:hypothetical protein
MRKNSFLALRSLALLVMCAVLPYNAVLASPDGKSHVHGTGSLDVVLDKDKVTIALELPLDVAVGFERAPKTDKEKTALIEASLALNAASTLFILNPEAKCTGQATNIVLPALEIRQHIARQKSEPAEKHADIEASYVFHCAHPAALKSLETTLFKQFKRLYRLETQRAGPAGQGAVRLTPKQPILKW